MGRVASGEAGVDGEEKVEEEGEEDEEKDDEES